MDFCTLSSSGTLEKGSRIFQAIECLGTRRMGGRFGANSR